MSAEEEIERWSELYGPGTGTKILKAHGGGRLLYNAKRGTLVHFRTWGRGHLDMTAEPAQIPDNSGIPLVSWRGSVSHELERRWHGARCKHCGQSLGGFRVAPTGTPKCAMWRKALAKHVRPKGWGSMPSAEVIRAHAVMHPCVRFSARTLHYDGDNECEIELSTPGRWMFRNDDDLHVAHIVNDPHGRPCIRRGVWNFGLAGDLAWSVGCDWKAIDADGDAVEVVVHGGEG